MPTEITITAGDVILRGELADTLSGCRIAEVLPIEVAPNVWGDEFYFSIPVALDLDETATTQVLVGTFGYWPPGNALAIFFGPTPMSSGMEPVPASEVNIVGRVLDDATRLRSVKHVKKIIIKKA